MISPISIPQKKKKKYNSTFKYSIEPVKKDKISHVVSKRMGYDSWLEGGTSLVPHGMSETFVRGFIVPLSKRQYH